MVTALKASKPHLMEYLPAIYQEADPSHPQTFLGEFLLAFEMVLLGLPKETTEKRRGGNGDSRASAEIRGLGEEIATLHKLFDAKETPEDFLPWLAGWAALSLRSDLSSVRKRKLLANIIPLYRIRGTKKYLETLLTICVDAVSSVNDVDAPPMQVGTHSTVGSDTYIGGGPPHFFSVTLVMPKLNQQEKEQQVGIAYSVIELAKPAHTFYQLSFVSSPMQVGVHSTVGLDTVLGPPSA
jgi:phage tail-like protein